MRDFEKIGFLTELDSGLETRMYEKAEIMALFHLKTDEELIHLLTTTQAYCQRNGMLTVFNQFVDFDGVFFEEATTEGVYLICIAHSEKDGDLISALEGDIVIRLLKFYAKKQKKKGGNKQKRPDLEVEDIMEYKQKKISSDLKVPNLDIEDKSHIFYNKRVVLTGNFSHFPIRNKMAQWIKEVGGNNNGSISKKTDYVIVGEGAGWRKMEMIEEFGIKTLTEEEFIALFPNKKI